MIVKYLKEESSVNSTLIKNIYYLADKYHYKLDQNEKIEDDELTRSAFS